MEELFEQNFKTVKQGPGRSATYQGQKAASALQILGSQPWHSSTIFSLARNFRLQTEVYKYHDVKTWDLDSIFDFKDDAAKHFLLQHKHLTEILQNFVPEEKETVFKNSTSKQRLMFYCQHYDFTNSEL